MHYGLARFLLVWQIY